MNVHVGPTRHGHTNVLEAVNVGCACNCIEATYSLCLYPAVSSSLFLSFHSVWVYGQAQVSQIKHMHRAIKSLKGRVETQSQM